VAAGKVASRQGTPDEGSLWKTSHWDVFLPSCVCSRDL